MHYFTVGLLWAEGVGGGEVGVKYYGDSYKGFSIEIPIRVMTNILSFISPR